MKLAKIKKTNIVLIISIALLLTAIITLGITSAMYTWQRQLSGNISFYDSIKIDTYGIEVAENEQSLMYYDRLNNPIKLTISKLQQTDEIKIVNPSVKASSETASYFLRAKVKYIATGGSETYANRAEAGYELTEAEINTLFSTRLTFNSSNWLEYNGYYYMVNENQSSWTNSRLNKSQLFVNAVGSNETFLFDSSCKLVVNDIEQTSDIIQKVGGVNIYVDIDAIQSTLGGFGAWEYSSVLYNYNIATGTDLEQKGSTYGFVKTEGEDAKVVTNGVQTISGYEDNELFASAYIKDGFLFRGWKAYQNGQEVQFDSIFDEYETNYNAIVFKVKKTDALLGDITLLAEVEQDNAVYNNYNLSIIVGTANSVGYYGADYGEIKNAVNLELAGTDVFTATVKENRIMTFEYEISNSYMLVGVMATTDSVSGVPEEIENVVNHVHIEGNRVTFDKYGATELRIIILVEEIRE